MLDAKRVLNDVPPALQGKLTRRLYELKAAGEPIVLAINGDGPLAVDDDESFHDLVLLIERIETDAAVREGLRYFDAGQRGLSLEEIAERLRPKHGSPL